MVERTKKGRGRKPQNKKGEGNGGGEEKIVVRREGEGYREGNEGRWQNTLGEKGSYGRRQ